MIWCSHMIINNLPYKPLLILLWPFLFATKPLSGKRQRSYLNLLFYINLWNVYNLPCFQYERTGPWYRLITVEPTMFFYMMAFMITNVIEQAFYVFQTCRVNHGYDDEICYNISEYKDINIEVQVGEIIFKNLYTLTRTSRFIHDCSLQSF